MLDLTEGLILSVSRCAALDTFEAMLASGSRPHAAVYSSIIDVLWQTGIPWAQAKALHLFNSAVPCVASLTLLPPMFVVFFCIFSLAEEALVSQAVVSTVALAYFIGDVLCALRWTSVSAASTFGSLTANSRYVHVCSAARLAALADTLSFKGALTSTKLAFKTAALCAAITGLYPRQRRAARRGCCFYVPGCRVSTVDNAAVFLLQERVVAGGGGELQEGDAEAGSAVADGRRGGGVHGGLAAGRAWRAAAGRTHLP